MSDRPLDVTFYERVNRPEPHRERLTWPELVRVLSRVRPVSGDKAAREAGLALWSPVRLVEGKTRASVNVESVGLLVLDYDDGTTVENALERWEGYERLVHTSWSHTPEAPRCRVVIPLVEPVRGEDWSPVIAWIMASDGREADRACKDAARQFYLPAVGVGGPHVAIRRPGAWMDLGDVVRVTRERAAQEEAERVRRRDEAAARIRRQVANEDQRDREARRALEVDPVARERLAMALGGRLARRMGAEVVKGVRCPGCGRESVWWIVDPSAWKGAKCEHRNSCGWSGRLYDLALQG